MSGGGGAAAALANFDHEDRPGDEMELPRMESVARESLAEFGSSYKPTIDTTAETFEGSDDGDERFFESDMGDTRAAPSHGRVRDAGGHDHDHDFSDHLAFEIAMETDHKNDDGTVFKPESLRQAIYLFLDQPGSTKMATWWSGVILLLIVASSFSFVFETHPFFMCKYSASVDSECSGDGDATSRESCEAGQSLVTDTQGESSLVNNTFTPGMDEVGMYAGCLAHSGSLLECEGTQRWYEAEPIEGASAGPSCAWNGYECEFIGLGTEECGQWVHPLQLPGQEDIGTPADAKEWRRRFRLAEVVAILIFTGEYLLRLLTCTSRPFADHGLVSYIKQPTNVIDLLAVVPFYLEFFVPRGKLAGLGILRVLRLARVFRVLKAGSVLKELRLFVWGYYRAREGLILLSIMLFLYLNVFACFLYLLEYDVQTEQCLGEDYTQICYRDLPDDGIDNVVMAFTLPIEGPNAPGPEDFLKTDGSPFRGPASDCNKCHFTPFNCSNGDGSFYTIVTTSPWDALSGDLVGACKVAVGNCTGAACDALISEVACDPVHQMTPSSSRPEDVDNKVLELGWFDQQTCLTCKDLGCQTKGFRDIPTTYYFIIATMTTVGYGDHYPVTLTGKFICGICMLMGIMVLALPLNIIGMAFEETGKEQHIYEMERKARIEDEKNSSSGGKSSPRAFHAKMAMQEESQQLQAEPAYHVDAAVLTVQALLHKLHRETGDIRYRKALDQVLMTHGSHMSMNM